MPKQAKQGSTFGAAMIICGTCVGGGMLALPSATSPGGAGPAMATNIICWLFMLVTGFLLMEACLWLPANDKHLPSLMQHYLGTWGKWLACGIFAFLYYCLLISYLSGGAPYFTRLLAFLSSTPDLSAAVGMTAYVSMLAAVLWLGSRTIARVNLILVVGLFASFAALILVGSGAITSQNLLYSDWPQSLWAAPILFGAYGYHNVIPSLVTYLKKDSAKLRIALCVGTLCPLVIYSLWQVVALGVVSQGELQAASGGHGIPIVESIIRKAELPWLSYCVYFFSFFAIITSILGVSFSMLDFLADGLRVRPHPLRRCVLTGITLVPPALIAYHRPNLFLTVFGYASGYGEAILNGCVPILIFWIGRHHLGYTPRYSGALTKPWLSLLFLMAITVMVVETCHLFTF